jgi:hypothetical protein
MQRTASFDFSRAKTPAQVDDWARHYRVELNKRRVFAKLRLRSHQERIARIEYAYRHDKELLEKKRRAAKMLVKALN